MAGVIVIGGANVDIKGRSQAAPIPATSNPGDVMTSLGGVGRNIAHTLALLAIDTAFIGFVGDDANGENLRRETAAAGVDISMLGTCPEPTGTYLAILDDRGELVTAINDMRATGALNPEHLMRHRSRLAAARMIVADCNISVSCLAWLFDFALQHSVKLVIEPISVPKSRKLLELPSWHGGFLVTPNAMQLEALTGSRDAMAGIAVLHRKGFRNAVVHRGREGAIASDGLAPPQVIAIAPAGQVSDVTGAGDAAVAGLVCGLILGHDIVASARLGQAAAALKIGSGSSIAAGINRDSILAIAGLK